MHQAIAGERLQIDQGADLAIRFTGRNIANVDILAVNEQGRIELPTRTGPQSWRISSKNEKLEIVAYVTDENAGGFVNQSYPIELDAGDQKLSLPKPKNLLAAIILGEVYVKNGVRRLKISNEGYAAGIDPYLAQKNLGRSELPRPVQPAAPQGQHQPADFGGMPSTLPPGSSASGSGVFVTPDIIVTNAHVIHGGVHFEMGRTKQTLLPISIDPMHDLALLQSATPGTPLPMRIGLPVWLGENIMASGYPLMDILGADLKVSTGNISGLSGPGGDISRFQFTAPIGSGSSGGAIIDENGCLIGITSASLAHDNMRHRGSISENVNFGVRSSLVLEMLGAAGIEITPAAPTETRDRRQTVNQLRSSVVSIIVQF